MIAAGADAARGAWLAVVVDDGRFADAGIYEDLGSLLAALPEAAAVAVDVPIGLPPPGQRRRADIEARTFVGPRRSSVFFAPSAEALAPSSYREARAIQPSLSAQAYALRRAILDAASCDTARLHEIHPEVSFRALAGEPLPFSKRTWNGQMRRRRLLLEAGVAIPDELPVGLAPADDVLDAAVAAWSATRIARGEHALLPADRASGEPAIAY
ncbi:MAG: DUF429 domain-containing protein [Actinomycetota bacterium]|nr:DUF429 domain-containing protein [Actinomycetota bacterium]